MVLEVAILNIRPGQEAAFERAMSRSHHLIAASRGFRALELRKCVERPNRYLLLVAWEKLEDHTVGFRQSDRYFEWKRALHDFYDPFPTVEHYDNPLPLTPGS